MPFIPKILFFFLLDNTVHFWISPSFLIIPCPSSLSQWWLKIWRRLQNVPLLFFVVSKMNMKCFTEEESVCHLPFIHHPIKNYTKCWWLTNMACSCQWLIHIPLIHFSYAPGWCNTETSCYSPQKKLMFPNTENIFSPWFGKSFKKEAKLINPEWILSSELYPLGTWLRLGAGIKALLLLGFTLIIIPTDIFKGKEERPLTYHNQNNAF